MLQIACESCLSHCWTYLWCRVGASYSRLLPDSDLSRQTTDMLRSCVLIRTLPCLSLGVNVSSWQAHQAALVTETRKDGGRVRTIICFSFQFYLCATPMTILKLAAARTGHNPDEVETESFSCSCAADSLPAANQAQYRSVSAALTSRCTSTGYLFQPNIGNMI